MKPTLLVLAAGMGSRYGGLKQIDPVGPSQEIIIDYSIFDAVRAGFGKVVFVIRKDIEETFKECVGSRFKGIIDVEYAYQELNELPAGFAVPEGREKPWGTGHAILMAADLIKEPFAVINADDFYGKSGYKLLADYLSQASDGAMAEYCMCGFMLRNTLSEHGYVSRGICETDSEGYLQDVEEITRIEKDGDGAKYNAADKTEVRLTGNEFVSMNMWGFTPSIFERLKEQFVEFLQKNGSELKSEFFIPTVVNNLIKSGKTRVKVLESGDSWFGITYKEDKPAVVESVARLVEDKVYPNPLFGGKAE